MCVDMYVQQTMRLLWAVLPFLSSLSVIGYVLQWENAFLSTVVFLSMFLFYEESWLIPVVLQLLLLKTMFMQGVGYHLASHKISTMEATNLIKSAQQGKKLEEVLDKDEKVQSLNQKILSDQGQLNLMLNAIINLLIKDYEELGDWLQNLFLYLADTIEWIVSIFR